MGRKREPSTFAKAVGVQESTGWTLWFVLCYSIALICISIALSGCMSAATKKYGFVKIDRDELLDSTVGKCSVSPERLNLPELPLHWTWGLSGVCAKYWDGYTACLHTFPSTANILDMVTFSVEARLRYENSDTPVSKKMEPWVTAWAEMKDELPSTSTVAQQAKVAGYLTLASTILSVLLLAAGILKLTVWKQQIRQWILYLGAFCDGAILIVVAAFMMVITNNGARATIRTSEVQPVESKAWAEEGLFIIFASVAMKLLSIGLVCMVICLPEIFIAKCCCPTKY